MWSLSLMVIGEIIGVASLGGTVLAALVQVVRKITKVEVKLDYMSTALADNTATTKQTQAAVTDVSLRVARLEGHRAA
jgi:hypothetical protein